MELASSITCCDDILFAKRLSGILSAYPHRQIVVLCDSGSREHCLSHLPIDLSQLNIVEIPSGEASKSLDSLQTVWHFLMEHGASRASLLLNLGGGMICDLGGFAASTFMRGIDFIHIPTTLLAMVDASIGGKNGIDFYGLKNSIGCFSMPEEVLIWPGFLRTLPAKELRSGYAEMMKHALLESESAWNRLSSFDICAPWDDAVMRDLIQESARIKHQFVQSDIHDFGKRQALNFGHTIGHALESLSLRQNEPEAVCGTSDYSESLPHGYAVAYGILCELYISTKMAGFPRDKWMEILYHIKSNYPAYSISCKDYPYLMEKMRHDKKNAGSAVKMTLLSDFGAYQIGQNPEEKLIIESLDFFQEFMS